MANTGKAYGNNLVIKDGNGVIVQTLTDVDLDIDSESLSEDTGGKLNDATAQEAIDTRFISDLTNCNTCLDPLPSGVYYGDYVIDAGQEESGFIRIDANNVQCLELRIY